LNELDARGIIEPAEFGWHRKEAGT